VPVRLGFIYVLSELCVTGSVWFVKFYSLLLYHVGHRCHDRMVILST
jgi:hypothetical protein